MNPLLWAKETMHVMERNQRMVATGQPQYWRERTEYEPMKCLIN